MKIEELPDWTECQSLFASGDATPLTEFIRAYEPVATADENTFRNDLVSLVTYVQQSALETALQLAADVGTLAYRERQFATRNREYFNELIIKQDTADSIAKAIQQIMQANDFVLPPHKCPICQAPLTYAQGAAEAHIPAHWYCLEHRGHIIIDKEK